MRCEYCDVVIRPEFTHAIKNNQCPACGKGIMQQAKLASFLSLRTLLENNIIVKGVDSDKLASLIVANFDLKQLFKEELQKSSEEGIIEDEEMIVDAEDDPDADFKAEQKEKAKAIMQKMRDEALAGALNDQGYDFDEGGTLMEDGAEMHEIVNREKQLQARNAVASGMGAPGSIRRSE